MMKLAEAVVFLSLATSLHIGVWAANPAQTGMQSSGESQEPAVVLQTASPQMAAIVRQWQTPPETIATPVALPMQTPDIAAAPKLPDVDSGMPLATLPARPDAPDLAPPPVAETEAPARIALPDMPEPARLNAPAAPTPDLPPARPEPRTERHAMLSPVVPAAPARPPLEALPMADVTPAVPAPPAPEPKPQTPNRQASAPVQGSGQDKAQAAQQTARNALQAKWGAQIQKKVHRSMVYPRGAKGSGTARIALEVNRSGKLIALNLVRSSGVAAFDAAAMDAVRRARRFAKAPRELSDASYRFTLSLTFRR